MAGDKARLPPRWFVVTFWHVHTSGPPRLLGGRKGLAATSRRTSGVPCGSPLRGRRSGEPRSVIVGYYEDGPNLVTMAMNGWGAAEPAWWLNLQAHPEADRRAGRAGSGARCSAGPRWARSVNGCGSAGARLDQNLDGYAARRPRETAVVILEPRARSDGSGTTT